MHYLIKELAPPIINTLRWFSFKYGWKGNYKTYEDAQKKCSGYDEDHIVKRIIESTNKVRNGEVPYERDGILYDEIKINFPLLNALLYVSAKNNNRLTLIDFGGSLGTTYYQNIGFLGHLVELNWCIIEQKHFVDIGKKSFENESVKFFYTIDECLQQYPSPDILICCGVLQYINQPYRMLQEIQSYNIPYLMLDTMGYNDKNEDLITVQNVPPVFYGIEASYPCTFFDKQKLEKQLESNYEKVYEFITEQEKYYIGFKPFRYRGSFWKNKSTKIV